MSHRVREHHQQLLKSEIGTLRKPLGLGLNIALAYANTYYIAMSNLGFQAVYKLLTSMKRSLANVPFCRIVIFWRTWSVHACRW